jgi:ABC-type multidrug transport system fused ATPase/permease subunit
MRDVWKVFRQGLTLLTPSGRRVLYFYGFGLILLAGLDGIALYFVSKVFIASSGGGSTIDIASAGPTLILVVVLFTLRTTFSTVLSWVCVKRFALEEVQVGSLNFDSLLTDSWNKRVDSAVNDMFNAVDRGPNSMVQGFLISVVTIISEVATAVVILGALMLLQPVTAIIAAIYFAVVAVAQHQLLSRSSSVAGESVVVHSTGVYATLLDAYSLSKLLSINPSQSLRPYLNMQRTSLALARGKVTFLGMLPRYFMELILAIGFALIGSGTYALSGSDATVSALTVFAAAGFRLLPIVNRIQGLVLQLFSIVPGARLAFIQQNKSIPVEQIHSGTEEMVLHLQEVTFQYPTANRPALMDINLVLRAGLQYAIVGPSGAGKTTLVDICLGLLQPQSGTVFCSPNVTVSYVPQETHIARLSLEQNIALEWDTNKIDTALARNAKDLARLHNILDGRAATAELSGQALSGGQKQRIGLARAIYRSPSLLFLDEVTSALDAETEHAVMSSIEQLRGSITVVIVAHRLSTVQHADQVIYVEEGKVLGIGTFEELRKSIPRLQRQIELGTLDLLD